ncbi:MAG: hypothetical protein IKX10_10330 [Lachnospiraceae bacterium]|nr:hypothetical protein [Lachnospiraceae bacterium]
MGPCKCKICGGDIGVEPGATAGVCDRCGTWVKLEPSDDESEKSAAKSKEQESDDARKKTAREKRKKRLTRVAELALVGVIAGISLFVVLKQKPNDDVVMKELIKSIGSPNIGDTICFGHYDDVNEWIVLDKTDDELLLLSKYAICHKAYNEVLKDVTWSTCSLRNWLNTEYLVQAFSAEEQELIADTNVRNDDDSWAGAPGGEDTVDKVFVLSIEEAQKYFEDNDSRITTFPDGEEASWWLRTPGHKNTIAADITIYGHIVLPGGHVIYDVGSKVDDANHGVRPALWIKLKP